MQLGVCKKPMNRKNWPKPAEPSSIFRFGFSAVWFWFEFFETKIFWFWCQIFSPQNRPNRLIYIYLCQFKIYPRKQLSGKSRAHQPPVHIYICVSLKYIRGSSLVENHVCVSHQFTSSSLRLSILSFFFFNFFKPQHLIYNLYPQLPLITYNPLIVAAPHLIFSPSHKHTPLSPSPNFLSLSQTHTLHLFLFLISTYILFF